MQAKSRGARAVMISAAPPATEIQTDASVIFVHSSIPSRFDSGEAAAGTGVRFIGAMSFSDLNQWRPDGAER